MELVDVRVRKIDLPEEVSESVLPAHAAGLRGAGEEAARRRDENAEKLRAEADRQRTEILAPPIAKRRSSAAKATPRSTEIYARTYSRDADSTFYRSLQAYRNSIGRDSDVMVIAPDSEFFHYLQKPEGR